jgi:two-component system, NtrC family, sensor kinase
MTPSASATLLVVDDDLAQLDLLEMTLTRAGYAVLRATSGEAALRILAERPEIDLMLLDVILPGGLDGLEVCRRVRTDLGRPYLPIIMVTALGHADQIARGLDAGADDYMTKPFTQREILARVQTALRVRCIQRDLAEAQHHYRVLVDAIVSRDLIFTLDTAGRLTYISPTCETLTGYPAETLLADDRPFQRFVAPEDAPRLAAWLDHRQPRPPDEAELEFRILRSDGDLRWGALAWTAITDRAGGVAGAQGAIRDITRRKHIEAAAWRRSQELAALNLIATRLNQSLELPTTLNEALDALLEVAGLEFGTIHVIDDSGQPALRAVRGRAEAEVRQAIGGAHHALSMQLRDFYVVRERRENPAVQITPPLKALGIQALLSVPLRQRGALNGWLLLASRALDKFDPAEITLISTVAEQISAAITNARLYEMTRQRADELALLNEIGRVMTSTLDLEKVLRLIMENAVSMLQGEAGSVLLLDEVTGELHFAAAVGPGGDQLRGVRLPAGAGLADRALREGRTLLIDNTQLDDQFYRGIDQRTGLTTRMLVAAPLRVHNRSIGVMEVINKRGTLFTAADVRLLDLLAPTAATAIDNARLYARETQLSDEVRRHNRELGVLHAIAAALSDTLEIKTLMDVALTVLQPQFEFDAGQLSLLDNSVHAHYRPSPACDLRLDQPAARHAAQQAIDACTVILLPDTTSLADAAIWRNAHIGAAIAAPLWGHDRVQGLLELAWCAPRDFGPETAPLLAAIGQQIGVALERAHLYEVAQHRAQEIERSHQQLVQSEKLAATGRLAMSLAHEINNPLQAIQNCLHLVLEFPLDDERQTYYLKMAREEVERLSLLVQSLLDFYRPARSEQTTADVSAVVDRMLALAEQKLRNNQIEVQLKYAPPPQIAQIAPDQLGQVCLNLIVNAAEAMEGGGQLRIEVQPVETWIEARFTDTGPGIVPADQPHIFEPFYTTKSEGTGLGLAISYSIVERHGGTLQMDSTVGQGTTFTLRLPRDSRVVE